jgi:hypothetical protein
VDVEYKLLENLQIGQKIMRRVHASSQCHHDSHHHGKAGGHHHHNDLSAEAAVSISAKEKLTIRLEHLVRHNKEHADSYRNLAGEAAELGAERASWLIAAAAENVARQNQDLEDALSLLKP